jgi:dolichol-phosphate mannosyltransferase
VAYTSSLSGTEYLTKGPAIKKDFGIVVVIPTLNEEPTIGKVIDGIRKVLSQLDYKILVVDGRSQDRTVSIALEKEAEVIFQKGKGYGDAYLTGFKFAVENLGADMIVMMDGDGTYSPHDVLRLLNPLLNNKVDFVIGNRFAGMDKNAMGLWNKFGNKLISHIAKWLLRIKVYDTQSGLRAFKSELLKKMSLNHTGMPFAIELLAEAHHAGARIIEVPISYHKRIGSTTKLNLFRDGLAIIGTMLRLARDYQPLLFFGLIGSSLMAVGGFIGLWIVVEWLMKGTVTRTASTILSALFITTGVQIFTVGLIADMIKGLRGSRSTCK